MPWKLKNLLGTSLQLLLQLLPQLLNFFARTLKSNSMKHLEKWSLKDGVLRLDFPGVGSYINLSHDRYLQSFRGKLPLLQWLSAIFRFLSVYRKISG